VRCTVCPSHPSMAASYTTLDGLRTYTYECLECGRKRHQRYAPTGPKSKAPSPHLHTVPASTLDAPFNPPVPEPSNES
jgi:hypothetical protein